MSLEPEQKVCRECVLVPTGFGKSISLPFMFHKKLGRNNSHVVVVHCYLQHLSLQLTFALRISGPPSNRT